MDNYGKMINQELYICTGNKIESLIEKKNEILDEFNQSNYSEYQKRKELISKLFNKTGTHFFIMKPFYCDYGAHISIGENFYCNADCIFLDVAKITIGNNCFMGPRVNLLTATHPIDADVRNENLEYGLAITIGNNCWIGGNVTINPGVEIGDNVVIGSGAVVTKNIESNCIAVGNPCKKLRSITKDDQLFWNKKRNEYYETIKRRD